MQHEITNVANANNRYGYSVLLKLTCRCGQTWTVRKSTYFADSALRQHERSYERVIAADRAAVATFSRFAPTESTGE